MSKFIEIDNKIINTDKISCILSYESNKTKVYFADKDDYLILDINYEHIKNIILKV